MSAAAGNLKQAQDHAQRALNNVRNLQPYLGDLADMVAIHVEPRIPTAGITADGRLFVNPDWFLSLSGPEAIYVMSHELWHLVLQSHARAGPDDAWHVNVAHDWIINRILTDELGIMPPKNGLWLGDADNHSAEELVRWLKDGNLISPARGSVWDAEAGRPEQRTPTPFEEALRGTHLAPAEVSSGDDAPADCPRDILTEEDLRRLSITVPVVAVSLNSGAGSAGDAIADRAEALRLAADAALGTHAVVTSALRYRHPDFTYPHLTATLDIIATNDRIPVELALQSGIDMIAPKVRTYRRASRRQGTRQDIVLPGRRHEGWVLNLILDTSGSMTGVLPRLLSLIKASAKAAGVSQVRIIQASDDVTADETVDIDSLESFEVRGYGGSDLTAAFNRLSEDPDTERVIVLSDMAIRYPAEPPPYDVVWFAIRERYGTPVAPEYGTFIILNV